MVVAQQRSNRGGFRDLVEKRNYMTRTQLSDAALLLGLRLCGPCMTCRYQTRLPGVADPMCRWHSRVIQDPELEGCTAHEEQEPAA